VLLHWPAERPLLQEGLDPEPEIGQEQLLEAGNNLLRNNSDFKAMPSIEFKADLDSCSNKTYDVLIVTSPNKYFEHCRSGLFDHATL